MDLPAFLAALVAPLERGSELVAGVQVADLSTTLGLRVSVLVEGRLAHLELSDAAEGGPFAARTPRMLVRYRSGEGDRALDGKLGLALAEALAAHVAPREDAAFARLAAANAEAGSDEAGARLREVQVERLLEPVGGAVPHFTVTPYVGCLIGCRFCYAQTRVGEERRLLGLPDVAWGSYLAVRVNAAEVLARELEAAPPRPVKVCPIVSDPYQSAEKRYRVTRSCLEALHAAREPRAVLVLTRSALVLRDIDLLARMARPYVGVSLPTRDDEVRRHFEPRADSVEARLEVLARFRAEGVRTFAVVQPILPGPIDALADALAARVDSVWIDVLQGVLGAAGDFEGRWAESQHEAWQRARAAELAAKLEERGVAIWRGDLPPDVIE